MLRSPESFQAFYARADAVGRVGFLQAVLPLLREERGSGPSTGEERIIGAGLQALEKNEDGPAVKKLFYAFAVTQVSGPLGCDLRHRRLYRYMHTYSRVLASRRRTLCTR